MWLFVRLTVALAVAVAAFFILAFVVKVIFFGALIAAAVIGAIFVVALARRARRALEGRGNSLVRR